MIKPCVPEVLSKAAFNHSWSRFDRYVSIY